MIVPDLIKAVEAGQEKARLEIQGKHRMNERIKELADQAGIAVWGDAVYMYDPKDTLDSAVMAKFAELIVAECIEQVITGPNGPAHYAVEAAIRLKKHFGVEE